MRFFFLAAAMGLLAACATTQPAAPGQTVQSAHTVTAPAADIDGIYATAQTVVNNLNYELASLSITQAPPAFSPLLPETEIAVHDSHITADGMAKIDNLTADTERSAAILASLQNAPGNGGWEQRSNGYFHQYSGMLCTASHTITLTDRDTQEAQVYQVVLDNIHIYDGKGYDTHCEYKGPHGLPLFTLYASYWPNISLQDHYARAVSDMENQLKPKSGAPLIAPTVRDEDAPQNTQSGIEGETLARAYLFDYGEQKLELKTAIWLNKTNGWHVKERATYLNGDIIAELLASILHIARLNEVDQHTLDQNPTSNRLGI